jgi:SET domain-containing protein
MEQEKLIQKLSDLFEEFPDLKEKLISCEEGKIQVVQKGDFSKEKIELPDVIKGPSLKIEIRRSPIHGYGIFAKELIPKGELIEEGKLLRLALRNEICFDWVLKDYVFSHNDVDNPAYHIYGSSRYLALGYLSLYNHQDDPNTTKKLDFQKELMWVKARREIQPGEEIFISYGKNYFKFRNILNSLSAEVRRQIIQSGSSE